MSAKLALGTDGFGFGFGGTGKKSHAGAFEPYGAPFVSATAGNYYIPTLTSYCYRELRVLLLLALSWRGLLQQ